MQWQLTKFIVAPYLRVSVLLATYREICREERIVSDSDVAEAEPSHYSRHRDDGKIEFGRTHSEAKGRAHDVGPL